MITSKARQRLVNANSVDPMNVMRSPRVHGDPSVAQRPTSPVALRLPQRNDLVSQHPQKPSCRSVSCEAGRELTAPPLQRILTWVHETMGKRERIVLTSEKSDLTDISELAKLWAEQLDRPELLKEPGLQAVQTALDNSFTVQFAFLETTDKISDSEEEVKRTLIGCARSISDGYFAAQVVDVCVADEQRRKGLGSQLLKQLCKDTKERGAQSIAVFTGPSNRLFFWRNGFRLDFRYRVMIYQPLKTNTDQDSAQEATVSELDELFGTRYM